MLARIVFRQRPASEGTDMLIVWTVAVFDIESSSGKGCGRV